MLSPIAPHICEHLWDNFFPDGEKIESSWPEFDESIIDADEFELIIQVNGKVRGKTVISKSMKEDEVKDLAKQTNNVKSYLDGNEIKKIIYVKDKLINFVI